MERHLNRENSIWLHRFAKLVVGATFVLIFIGGLVTSTDSGLAVPDWPSTYGYFMFSFPLSQMVGGIVYEHGHRMVASVVGFLMTVLAIWIWLKEPRSWVRKLAGLALLAVIAQGILGGITVLFLLPTAVSVSHGALAQTFFCMTICLAAFTSPKWNNMSPAEEDDRRPSLQSLAIATTAMIYVQLLLGAVMRHTKSGLAIPDFPLAFGGIIPPFESAGVAIHFAHRVGALAVLIMVAWTVTRIVRHRLCEPRLLRPAILIAGVLVAQFSLGALIIWTQKAVIPTTAHVAMGAFTLGTSLMLAIRAHRLTIVPARVQEAEEMNGAVPEGG